MNRSARTAAFTAALSLLLLLGPPSLADEVGGEEFDLNELREERAKAVDRRGVRQLTKKRFETAVEFLEAEALARGDKLAENETINDLLGRTG